MQITVRIEDESIAQNILWFLSNLKDKGVEIIDDLKTTSLNDNSMDSTLKELDSLIKTSSKNATLVDIDSILNPHKELSSDIS